MVAREARLVSGTGRRSTVDTDSLTIRARPVGFAGAARGALTCRRRFIKDRHARLGHSGHHRCCLGHKPLLLHLAIHPASGGATNHDRTPFGHPARHPASGGATNHDRTPFGHPARHPASGGATNHDRTPFGHPLQANAASVVLHPQPQADTAGSHVGRRTHGSELT